MALWATWAVLFTPPAQASPPNIVFILADDLDVGVFRNQGTLNSLLAAKGITFSNHFVSLSLCCPSRVTTLRGQYAHNSGIYMNQMPYGGFAKAYNDGLEQSTVATWLQAAGYRTALIGKYLNGYPEPPAPNRTYIPPGWTYWISPNGGDPYSEYNYSLNENGTTVAYGNAPEDYLADVMASKAAAFIKTSAVDHPNQPFFLYIAPYVPHSPATPPPRYAALLPDVRAPRGASFNEADVSDKPAWVRTLPLLSPRAIADIDALYRKRRQSMLAMDDLVKTVVDTLQATGQLDNTYLFFTSDNGFHQGQHRLNSGKNTAFEEDIHVPLVVRGPGVPAGRVINEITANVDYAPTFAELAGVTPPSFVDGRSLGPFLSGSTPSAWRQVLLLEHEHSTLTSATANRLLEPPDPYDAQMTKRPVAKPPFAGLRTANGFTYVEYDTGEHELYDLKRDPGQINNAYTTLDPALKARFFNRLKSLRTAAGQPLRDAEQALP